MSYRVRKKTKGKILIKGVEFSFGKEIKVSKELFEYISKTFPTTFELFSDVKVESKKENEQDEIKETTKKSVSRKGRKQKDK